MKLAILSDIHGSILALDQALTGLSQWQPDYYLLLGDLLNHGPRNPIPDGYAPIQVAERLNGLREQIIAVRGNCDSEVDQALLEFPCLAPHNQLLVDGHRLFLTHGHLYTPEALPLRPGDVLVSGHTHLPVLEREATGRVRMNPGSITFPRGEQAASYGRYEAGRLSLHRLDDGVELAALALG